MEEEDDRVVPEFTLKNNDRKLKIQVRREIYANVMYFGKKEILIDY